MVRMSATFAWNHCPVCGAELGPAHDGQSDRPHCARCDRFYYSNPTPAACCVVTRGSDVLFVQRAVEPCKGMWSLPGGFVELYESPEEAARRELEEETGLRAVRMHLLGTNAQKSRFGAVLVIAYAVDAWEGDIVAGSDAMAAGFFATAERPPLAFQAHRDLVDRFDALGAAGHPLLPV